MPNKHTKIPRFVADEMNGDLAKWLRMMGFDCLYIKGDNIDKKLLEICKQSDRILLTSDKELFLKAVGLGLEAILTIEKSRKDKLKKIVNNYNLDTLIGKEYRCPLCNHKLQRKLSISVADKLPENIVKRHKYVWICGRCGKLYWEGTHWNKILNFINEIVK